MAIDFENSIYPTLIESIEFTVGSRLSQTSTPEGTYPSIIRKRADGTRPELNYITIDIENIRLPSGWLLDTCVEHTNDEVITTHQVLYEMSVAFECYGDDSFSILQEYCSEFNVPDGISYRLQRDAGIASHFVSDVKSIPKLLTTNYEERAKLTVSFYVHDVIVRNSTYVETINGNGTIIDAEGNTVKVIDISAP